MAVNTPLFTVAAAVAAVGAFCGFESHRHPSTSDSHNESYSRQDGELNRKSNVGRSSATSAPQVDALHFAPQFDGLHCYETLISH